MSFPLNKHGCQLLVALTHTLNEFPRTKDLALEAWPLSAPAAKALSILRAGGKLMHLSQLINRMAAGMDRRWEGGRVRGWETDIKKETGNRRVGETGNGWKLGARVGKGIEKMKRGIGVKEKSREDQKIGLGNTLAWNG
jgi:hypothetical protein